LPSERTKSAVDGRRISSAGHAQNCIVVLGHFSHQGLESLGSATNFEHYIETIYKPVVKPLMATTSFDRTRGVLDNYLIPAFGKCCLRDLTALTLQTYFSKLTTSTTNQMLSHESRDKIRDVLSSALRFAVQHDLLVRNPAESLRIPPDKRGKKRNSPTSHLSSSTCSLN
jgi:Phage integrase, N-terminal SAM-like domain